ncbi:putative signal peptide protein [Puccinia sorghi]|uniref:Putative signal peptide protein n=1 Tax=Puccinia sorghi TaxID=27349 RepID=A0A0L6V156_9BASI|nr:putative signal peptide protein [Puccinia sorghi]
MFCSLLVLWNYHTAAQPLDPPGTPPAQLAPCSALRNNSCPPDPPQMPAQAPKTEPLLLFPTRTLSATNGSLLILADKKQKLIQPNKSPEDTFLCLLWSASASCIHHSPQRKNTQGYNYNKVRFAHVTNIHSDGPSLYKVTWPKKPIANSLEQFAIYLADKFEDFYNSEFKICRWWRLRHIAFLDYRKHGNLFGPLRIIDLKRSLFGCLAVRQSVMVGFTWRIRRQWFPRSGRNFWLSCIAILEKQNKSNHKHSRGNQNDGGRHRGLSRTSLATRNINQIHDLEIQDQSLLERITRCFSNTTMTKLITLTLCLAITDSLLIRVLLAGFFIIQNIEFHLRVGVKEANGWIELCFPSLPFTCAELCPEICSTTLFITIAVNPNLKITQSHDQRSTTPPNSVLSQSRSKYSITSTHLVCEALTVESLHLYLNPSHCCFYCIYCLTYIHRFCDLFSSLTHFLSPVKTNNLDFPNSEFPHPKIPPFLLTVVLIFKITYQGFSGLCFLVIKSNPRSFKYINRRIIFLLSVYCCEILEIHVLSLGHYHKLIQIKSLQLGSMNLVNMDFSRVTFDTKK